MTCDSDLKKSAALLGGTWAWEGAVKMATDYNGNKPRQRQPERRQNGKAKMATHLKATTKTATVYE